MLQIFNDNKSLSKAAADHAASTIREAISLNGNARIIAATGTSQFEFLDALVGEAGINWGKVEAFHLDEYVGLPIAHPASFRKILLEHLIEKTGIPKFHTLDGERDPAEVIARVGRELATAAIDVAFVGIGENGHLAFNDPPADFETEEPYLIVSLDEACRQQQVGEGWFADISQVPKQAISMSIRQILKSKEIIAVVPEARKARAVKACFEGPVSPMAPASILRSHPDATIYLDRYSAGLLTTALETSTKGVDGARQLRGSQTDQRS
jgi:glucosamine-6-phosphate deaminase